ncbi:CapA family protein [Deinococcus hopiensis]|uniref:Poly-gamma-glutamate synthesis protein (Capsule biosynthesis protein) n=1 Tax=Deinococcus hopiensis KR-140 TaxID=695939 RepID=A0A1W1VRR5_9DEIO|nr:CapA family protein [Deinococcus hopiensis]SMB96047.1 poly-gamma-glutamate synthesis protein (capsule biosynthesis protein) [Deinococcus hopiensis KR-140]
MRAGPAVFLALVLTSGGREPGTLTLAFAGDVSVARGVASQNAGHWETALSGVSDALRADVTYGNLESPLTVAPYRAKGIDLRASPSGVAALAPFALMGVENNHAQDGGEAGRVETRGTLRRAGILPVTRALTVTQVKGISVAWIAFFNDGHTPPPLAAIREGARRARVVVGVHWGAEYGPVTDRQRLLARQLAAAGATLIVGSGPHVLQGTERIGTTLVLYSLGNLLLDQPYPLARLGAVVRVTVEEDGIHACAVPTRYRAGRVTPAPGKERAKALARLGLPACTEAR